ncbi:MAG: ribosomal RNA small subunit methyltransferase A [Cytophagia bacterium]|jgi:16S rRNA (adenine1518-N6/adenine1519-N6)-dimethyltransferase|nr:ribosomal RNA small subunit methyltransferase A [Cytophagia bacterium]|tara:strand:- start:1700 stop:2464 length:765 start_codon:yes stop_codon:yes gene_type:complete
MIKFKNKKKLGQHFLINETIAKSISNTFDGRDNVLEIGPGMGILTKYVTNNTSKLILIEIDPDCVKHLNNIYSDIKIINDDILKINLNNLFDSNFSIISNLPYNISSQVFFKILESRNLIDNFTFMLQKEVGVRICSKPCKKTYGILSVLIQIYFDVQYVFDVDSVEFNPPPRVMSCVIKGNRNKRSDIGVSFSFLKNIVKNSFQNRRKTLRNSLKNLNLPNDFTSKKIFSRRAEQLDLDEFIWLSKKIKFLKQ